MTPSPNKRYLVGPEDELRALFPEYKGNDERTLPDGSFLIEVNCTPEELAAVEKSMTINAFTHEEVIRYIQQFDPESRDVSQHVSPKPSTKRRRSK